MNKNMIPNLFTFANLACGILSILFTLTNKPVIAAVFVITAALIDRYDGRVARRLDVSSVLGKELDSLADLVSFGAAPAVLGWSVYLNNFGILGYIITILYPICGAYRLARFNVSSFDNVFSGVPITVAGAVAGLDIIIGNYLPHGILSAILLILLSYLMVSKIQFKKF